VTNPRMRIKKEKRKTNRQPPVEPLSVAQHYQRRPTRSNLASLIESYRGIVECLVQKIMRKLPPTVDVQDLIQAGMFGLIQAARRFDESRGVPFESFCRTRIRGSILDELRSLNWLPRSNGNGLGARRLFLHLAGDFLGEMDQDCQALQEDSRHENAALEVLYREEMLEKVKKSLTTMEWRILHDSYIRGLTLKQVARRLSISPSHVCNLRNRIIAKVRRQMETMAV